MRNTDAGREIYIFTNQLVKRHTYIYTAPALYGPSQTHEGMADTHIVAHHQHRHET
jgi:hypothetical protein